MTSASPRSILVFSGRYHIISNTSLVNNCIMINLMDKKTYFYTENLSLGQVSDSCPNNSHNPYSNGKIL